MADGIAFAAWLEDQLSDAPAELAQRTREYLARAGGTGPEQLVAASELALEEAVALPRDRRSALDLLAADALVTLALAASVESDPAGFEAFARSIRQRQGSASA
jgi:hypothetical protein